MSPDPSKIASIPYYAREYDATPTAHDFAAYRASLLDAGLPEGLADAIVLDAASVVHRGGVLALETEVRRSARDEIAEAAAAKRAAREAQLRT